LVKGFKESDKVPIEAHPSKKEKYDNNDVHAGQSPFNYQQQQVPLKDNPFVELRKDETSGLIKSGIDQDDSSNLIIRDSTAGNMRFDLSHLRDSDQNLTKKDHDLVASRI
jgi:hypothetical protein